MTGRSKNLWLLAASIVAVLTTTFIWQSVVLDPANICLEIGGDGGKNYFTYLYHSVYGKGVWFEGMNYPYGEHIVYTDAQPLFSVPLSYLPGIDFATALTVTHLAIMISFAIGTIFVYRILTHFKVHPAVAIVFSVLIMAMSPQVQKVFGHFGLAYMSVLPMVFYWTVLYHEQEKLKYPVYIFLLGVATSFIHPYFAGVLFVWAGFYSLACLIVMRTSYPAKFKRIIPVLAAAAAIVLVLKITMSLTDPVKDRPQYPHGIFEGLTLTRDIFMFRDSPVSQFLHEKNILEMPAPAPSEGTTYPGIAVLAITIIYLASLIVVKARKKHTFFLSASSFSPVWLLLGFFGLLLAMGVPFIWNMEWLLDYLSVFRQFRTLGRFSWIFYYVITVFAVVALYHWYISQQKGKLLATCVLISVTVVWAYEARGYVRHVHSRLSSSLYNNYTFLSRVERNWNIYLESINYKPSDFQAVIAWPYTHVGSEKIWLLKDKKQDWMQVLSWRVCVQTGLPFVNVMMSRTSWSQTFKQVRIAGGPLTHKPILETGDKRPFLVLVQEQDSIADPDLTWLLAASEKIGSHSDLKAYKLYPDKLNQADSSYKAVMAAASSVMGIEDKCINGSGYWYVNHFDDARGDSVLFGAGAAKPVNGHYLLTTVYVPKPQVARTHEFSVWFLSDDKSSSTPNMLVEYLDENEESLHVDILNTSWSTDNKGMWMRASGLFNIPPKCKKLRLKVVDDRTNYKGIDELMIRPVDATIISKSKDGAVMVNNHFLYRP